GTARADARTRYCVSPIAVAVAVAADPAAQLEEGGNPEPGLGPTGGQKIFDVGVQARQLLQEGGVLREKAMVDPTANAEPQFAQDARLPQRKNRPAQLGFIEDLLLRRQLQ